MPTLDAGASVAKSDTLVTRELQEKLRAAFDFARLASKL
jgi:hypothetical protein